MVLSMAVGYALIAAPASNPALSPATPAPGRTVQPTAVPATATAPAPTITPIPLPARPTADSAATQYSFAIIGDSQGNAGVYEALLKQVEADGNAFLIHVGGIAQTGAEAEFQAWRETMAKFTLPFYTAPGSTDLKSGSPANYLAFTGAPSTRYAFDHGMVHFAVVDASRGYLTVEDSAWLDADLAGTQKAVKVVVLHAPPFDPGRSDQVMTRGNDAFMTMMKQRGVKYVFAASVHAYDKTFQDGVTYVISGGGGASLSRSEADGGFYHYVRVSVNGADVQTEVRRLK
jgi:hypothetical protein